jgi:cyanophycinase-like exopeptidase
MPGWILASGGNEFSDIYAEADLAALEKRKNKTSALLVVVTAPFPTQLQAYQLAKRYFAKLGIETIMSPILSENDLSAENVSQLAQADAIYFAGGTPARLTKSFVGTTAETAIRKALENEAVIMGSSAGAMLFGSKVVMPGGNEIGKGLNLLENQIVLAHFGGTWPGWIKGFQNQDFDFLGLAEGGSVLTPVTSSSRSLEFGKVFRPETNI